MQVVLAAIKLFNIDQWRIQDFPDGGGGVPTYYLANLSQKM